MASHAIICVVGALLASSPSNAATSGYPNHAIKLIVPLAPGGPTDVFARILAEGLTDELGQAVIVENRAGAGGVTGFASAASAAPDGYTLVIADPSITILPSLYDTHPYKVEDLTPISLVVRGTTVLVARKTLEAGTPLELVALAKREPGKLTYGSAGNGSFPHLTGELFKLANGIDIRHVPYRGGAPALTDLVAGRIDVSFMNVGTARAYIVSGSIKALAVGGRQRTPRLPEIPTYYETNLPDPRFDLGSWWGILGPPNLPADIRDKLNAALAKVLRSPQVLKRLDEMSADALPSTPEGFSEIIAAERKKWAEVVRQANIKEPN